MRKIPKKIIGLILAIVLCLAVMPMSAMATDDATDTTVQDAIETQNGNADDTVPIQQNDGIEPSQTLIPELSSDEVTDGQASEESAPQSSESPIPESVITPKAPDVVASAVSNIQPEFTKVVDQPLVEVVYHYYDADKNQSIDTFEDYIVDSTHSFYAIARADGLGITIAANKYPGKVTVNTEALRFRVIADAARDITLEASYDAATGQISLPTGYMGHSIKIEWYCPTSEITEVPVRISVCINQNGKYTTTDYDLALPSNVNTISVPLPVSNGVIAAQNGIDLMPDSYAVSGENLNITTAALGGNIIVSAYAPDVRSKNKSITPMSTAITQVVHTRSAEQIYYGYYTSYYTANGNTALCLNPNVSGLNAGTYGISRWLQRGQDDLLIKMAYYLYGGPGYNSVKNNLFGEPDSLDSYGLCHAAASYVYLNDPSAFRGLSSEVIGHLQRLIAAINVQAMPPAGFDVFIYNEGGANQCLMSWNFTPNGSLEIVKVSSNPSITDGNSCYSLEGAEFDIYNSSDSKIGTIRTGADGHGRLDDIPADTGYYAIERTPPKGFELSTTPIKFDIISEQTTTKEVVNTAQNDPAGIILRKKDGDTNANQGQGGAGLADAEFTVKYYKGFYSNASQLAGISPARTWVIKTDGNGIARLRPDYLVSGDQFYLSSKGSVTIPLGTISVQESKAAPGYLINSELFIRQITSEGFMESVSTYNEPIVPETVIRGGVSIQKWDALLNRPVPEGDGSLAGAVFQIYNRTGGNVVVNGKTYGHNQIVYTMKTDASGSATTANNLLPYGQWEVVESDPPPTGYLHTGRLSQKFSITANGVIVSLKADATAIKNNPITGGVEIRKYDIELNEAERTQGDIPSLAGAVLEIWNRGKNNVIVDGMEYAPNTVVYTMTTNEAGYAVTPNNFLPYSTYEIIEKSSPTGMLNTGIIKQTFQIRKQGEVVSLLSSDKAIKNNIVRGGVKIEKWDNEIDEHRPQGGATLEGAEIEIVNRSINPVLVLGKLYNPGEVVYKLTTDETGMAQTPKYLLPYGTYEAREITPPLEGYLATGVLSRTFQIREHGKIVELNSSETAIKNNPIRGDIRGVKISDGDSNRLAGVPFKITSKTTGESHTVVTDQNGEFNTASSWNPHSQHTNRGQTDRDGVWFGELDTLDDDVGALLFDSYVIDEQRCAANSGMELLTFEVAVYRHDTVINLGTLTDDYTQTPEIFTTAVDKETTLNNAYTSKETTLLDTIYYSGLSVGKLYTVRGILMDQETNSPVLIGGDEVVAEKTFRALSVTGSVTTEFVFDATTLKGKSIVIFEELHQDGALIAEHKDISSTDQTIRFWEPSLQTKATSDGEKTLIVHPKTKLSDTIEYKNLIPDNTYRVVGTLMDRDTGEPLIVNGQEVITEATIRPKESSGSLEMEFVFDSTSIMGKTVVVFEELYFNENLIAEHKDIESDDQSIKFAEPHIQTVAADDDGGKQFVVNPETRIYDKVLFENLIPDKAYQLIGTLMDQETGAPLILNGKKVTAEMEFTPKESSGSVTMEFVFDSTGMEGKSLVVFEELYHAGVFIAEHKDINSSDQTIQIVTPAIKTAATDNKGEQEVTIDPKTMIEDTVTFENLVPNKSYQIMGILMDKASGEPVLINGQQVTAKENFTPKESSGSVVVGFTFNSMDLKGRTVVVFEEVYHDKVLIAEHKDINDIDQSIKFKDIPLAVELTKMNSETNELLDGAEFILRDQEGNDVKLKQGEDGIYYPDANGEATIKTKTGKAVINGLNKQKMTLIETKAPADFEGYLDPIALQLEYDDTTDNPFLVTVYNAPEGSKTGVGAKTGRDGLPLWILPVGIASASAAVYIIMKKRKIKSNEEN